ncbi:MAG: hypothetical protein KGL39_49005 [Patescibacteria group bacterium]|nr:hypothetical protein [Patescibacteria group bacterium]
MTKDEACAEVARQAGWVIPPDSADPFVIEVAFESAIALQGGADEKLLVAAAVLGWRSR